MWQSSEQGNSDVPSKGAASRLHQPPSAPSNPRAFHIYCIQGSITWPRPCLVFKTKLIYCNIWIHRVYSQMLSHLGVFLLLFFTQWFSPQVKKMLIYTYIKKREIWLCAFLQFLPPFKSLQQCLKLNRTRFEDDWDIFATFLFTSVMWGHSILKWGAWLNKGHWWRDIL